MKTMKRAAENAKNKIVPPSSVLGVHRDRSEEFSHSRAVFRDRLLDRAPRLKFLADLVRETKIKNTPKKHRRDRRVDPDTRIRALADFFGEGQELANAQLTTLARGEVRKCGMCGRNLTNCVSAGDTLDEFEEIERQNEREMERMLGGSKKFSRSGRFSSSRRRGKKNSQVPASSRASSQEKEESSFSGAQESQRGHSSSFSQSNFHSKNFQISPDSHESSRSSSSHSSFRHHASSYSHESSPYSSGASEASILSEQSAQFTVNTEEGKNPALGVPRISTNYADYEYFGGVSGATPEKTVQVGKNTAVYGRLRKRDRFFRWLDGGVSQAVIEEARMKAVVEQNVPKKKETHAHLGGVARPSGRSGRRSSLTGLKSKSEPAVSHQLSQFKDVISYSYTGFRSGCVGGPGGGLGLLRPGGRDPPGSATQAGRSFHSNPQSAQSGALSTQSPMIPTKTCGPGSASFLICHCCMRICCFTCCQSRPGQPGTLSTSLSMGLGCGAKKNAHKHNDSDHKLFGFGEQNPLPPLQFFFELELEELFICGECNVFMHVLEWKESGIVVRREGNSEVQKTAEVQNSISSKPNSAKPNSSHSKSLPNSSSPDNASATIELEFQAAWLECCRLDIAGHQVLSQLLGLAKIQQEEEKKSAGRVENAVGDVHLMNVGADIGKKEKREKNSAHKKEENNSTIPPSNSIKIQVDADVLQELFRELEKTLSQMTELGKKLAVKLCDPKSSGLRGVEDFEVCKNLAKRLEARTRELKPGLITCRRQLVESHQSQGGISGAQTSSLHHQRDHHRDHQLDPDGDKGNPDAPDSSSDSQSEEDPFRPKKLKKKKGVQDSHAGEKEDPGETQSNQIQYQTAFVLSKNDLMIIQQPQQSQRNGGG